MITLIGKDLAKKGNEFIFYGSVDECENCRFKASCVDSLEKNRKYKIIDVRDNEQKCPVHAENTVIPVEVDRSNITLLSSSKSIFKCAILLIHLRLSGRIDGIYHGLHKLYLRFSHKMKKNNCNNCCHQNDDSRCYSNYSFK